MKDQTPMPMLPDDEKDLRKLYIDTFIGMGGAKKFLNWAKSHQTVFYSMFDKKMAPQQVMIDQHVSHHVDADGAEQIGAAMVDALTRVITTERKIRNGEIERAVAVTIDNGGGGERLVTYHGGSDATPTSLAAPSTPTWPSPSQPPRPSQPAPDPPLSPRPKPVTPRIVHSSGPPIIGLCAGAANSIDGADDGRSTNEKALAYLRFGQQE